ncbi:MAG: hypothetical protein HC850_12860 [Rhodomicrobium sp.]|nr:hypothetical protein [Rhodomicrobium sp.]
MGSLLELQLPENLCPSAESVKRPLPLAPASSAHTKVMTLPPSGARAMLVLVILPPPGS